MPTQHATRAQVLDRAFSALKYGMRTQTRSARD